MKLGTEWWMFALKPSKKTHKIKSLLNFVTKYTYFVFVKFEILSRMYYLVTLNKTDLHRTQQ